VGADEGRAKNCSSSTANVPELSLKGDGKKILISTIAYTFHEQAWVLSRSHQFCT